LLGIACSIPYGIFFFVCASYDRRHNNV
jgi:hypothetical protein